MLITSSVHKLEAYTPGEQPKSKHVIKLNTNENPYPPSPKCRTVLKNFDIDQLRRYPDPVFMALREEIAKLNSTSTDNVFVGNGSDEILTVAAKSFVENSESIGSLDPSYSLYKTLAAIRDVKWLGFDPRKDKTPKNVSLYLWTNPNAPTGEFAKIKDIAAFAKSFPGVVIVDEAYADFARENAMRLSTSKTNKNIIVMRTFSKSYSLAGLRVGYCVGPKKLIGAMYKVKDSYNVDALAQSLALAAIKDQAWMKKNAAKVIKTRERLTTELIKLGWDVIPSESNFVFAKPAHKKAAVLFEDLKGRHIYVRYFTGPKTADRLRVTIGTDTEINELLKAIHELDN